ncbi:MAG: hypothetical protein R3Y04_01850 [Rikenellaceae bacterium]
MLYVDDFNKVKPYADVELSKMGYEKGDKVFVSARYDFAESFSKSGYARVSMKLPGEEAMIVPVVAPFISYYLSGYINTNWIRLKKVVPYIEITSDNRETMIEILEQIRYQNVIDDFDFHILKDVDLDNGIDYIYVEKDGKVGIVTQSLKKMLPLTEMNLKRDDMINKLKNWYYYHVKYPKIYRKEVYENQYDENYF